MKERIVAFFGDIDAALVSRAAGDRLTVYIIGRSALVWRFGSKEVTADIDVLCPAEGPLLKAALDQYGRGTGKAKEHGLYLEHVAIVIPVMAPGYRERATPFAGGWAVLEMFHLDPHDLIISKLVRFAAKDRQDIQHLCDHETIDPDKIRALLKGAYPWVVDRKVEEEGWDDDPKARNAYENVESVYRYLNGDSESV